MDYTKAYPYNIRFTDASSVPDLTGPAFQEFFQVERVIDDMVLVRSLVNDSRLKELIATECQLNLSDFSVSNARHSIFFGTF